MILGGDIKGGRVIADWPGLSNGALYEERDLKPTINLDTLIASITAESFGIDPARVTNSLFPQNKAAKPLSGLIRS